ncbi:MAG: hypothetical protein L0215_11060 [Gemmataceae bacterium]|nr:hypothetical protein [Gemmataceae bacterium]
MDLQIKKPDEVRAYFAKFPDCAALVPTVCRFTREEFGPQPEMTLEVYSDPEFVDHYLKLDVFFSSFAPEILDRIERVWGRVEKERGVDLCEMPGWMIIRPMFRPPVN